MAEQWLSIVEYARTYAVSDMTVRRRIKNGKLHAVLKDGKYYIPVIGAATPPPEVRPAAIAVPAGQARSLPSYPRPRAEDPRQETLMKGHPAAHGTYMPQAVARPNAAQARPATPVSFQPQGMESAMDGQMIPESLTQPLRSAETAMVDTRALLAFCEAALKRSSESERRQSEKFRYKMSSLEEKLQKKDMEINQLRQQIEDLKVLINILEKKSA